MKLSVSTRRILFLLVIWFDLIPPQAVRQRYELTWFVLFVCTYFLLLCPPSLMISIVFFFCVCVLEEFSVRFMSKLNRNAFLSLLGDWPETGPRKFLGLLYYQARVLFFSFFLTCQNFTSNQRIFMNAIYSEKWRKTRTNDLKLKSPNLGKKLGEKTKNNKILCVSNFNSLENYPHSQVIYSSHLVRKLKQTKKHERNAN
jgi:hypothetical protein